MTRLEALGMFELMDRSDWDIEPVPHDDQPQFMAALASLSGQLVDCTDEIELKAAADYGLYLFNEEIISSDQWAAEFFSIGQELIFWGDHAEAELKRIAESN